jgi:hypothetical protein
MTFYSLCLTILTSLQEGRLAQLEKKMQLMLERAMYVSVSS